MKFTVKNWVFEQTLNFYPYIFGTQSRKLLIIQTMNYILSIILSVKYQRFTKLGSKDIGTGKFKFLAKTQVLLTCFNNVIV